jgi:NAD(P)-dependent dehydrogenase (short-subunit alcohol dehydrogenase family)
VRVFIAALDAGSAAELAAEAGARFLAVDLTAPAAAGAAVEECLEAYGSIDALFNVAGISGRRFGDGPVDECTDEGWSATLETNLTTMFRLCRAVLRYWIQAGRAGSIVNMASVSAESPEPRFFATHAYAASKGAVISMTKAMASYYAPRGIRVNAIAPGLVRTPMSRRAQQDPEVLEFMQTKQPLASLIEPEEVARAALFLLGGEAACITGQVLTVDAGWSLS